MRRTLIVIAAAAVAVTTLAGPAEAANLKVKARGGGGYGKYVDRDNEFQACDTRRDGKRITVRWRAMGMREAFSNSTPGSCTLVRIGVPEGVRVGLKVCKKRPGPNCTGWRRTRA